MSCVVSLLEMKFSEKSGKSGRDTICNSAFKVGWCFLWKWYWIDGWLKPDPGIFVEYHVHSCHILWIEIGRARLVCSGVATSWCREVWEVYFIFRISWRFKHQLSQKGSTTTSRLNASFMKQVMRIEHLNIFQPSQNCLQDGITKYALNIWLTNKPYPNRTWIGWGRWSWRETKKDHGGQGVDGSFAGTQRWFWIEPLKRKHINCFTMQANEFMVFWQSPGVYFNCFNRMQEWSEQVCGAITSKSKQRKICTPMFRVPTYTHIIIQDRL